MVAASTPSKASVSLPNILKKKPRRESRLMLLTQTIQQRSVLRGPTMLAERRPEKVSIGKVGEPKLREIKTPTFSCGPCSTSSWPLHEPKKISFSRQLSCDAPMTSFSKRTSFWRHRHSCGLRWHRRHSCGLRFSFLRHPS